MQHGIAVDAIILGVGALIGVDRTREVALLAQQIIELDAHTKRTAFKEALRKLSIPHQFVGVKRTVGISATTVLVQVGGELHAPRKGEIECSTVCKLPSVEVVLQLKLIFGMGVSKRSIEF